MDFLHGSPTQTSNTDLAAALCTLGIPRNVENPMQVFVGEMQQVAWYFEQASSCGNYLTQESIGLWDSPTLDRDRPSHAITYMRSGLRSRSRLLDYVRRRTRIGIASRPGGRFEVVNISGDPSAPTSPARRAPTPDAATTPRLQTDDLELAAALLSCGVPLWRDVPIERRADDRVSFFFQPCSPCGQFHARELILAAQDPTWHERHPEHPFSYLWCVFENRRRLMREVRTRVPMVTFFRAGYPQFLSMNADAKTEKNFMDALKTL